MRRVSLGLHGFDDDAAMLALVQVKTAGIRDSSDAAAEDLWICESN